VDRKTGRFTHWRGARVEHGWPERARANGSPWQWQLGPSGPTAVVQPGPAEEADWRTILAFVRVHRREHGRKPSIRQLVQGTPLTKKQVERQVGPGRKNRAAWDRL
jgi:hypothetical protein